jgi:predicted nucleic-acid-binding Zn-ribbon protein
MDDIYRGRKDMRMLKSSSIVISTAAIVIFAVFAIAPSSHAAEAAKPGVTQAAPSQPLQTGAQAQGSQPRKLPTMLKINIGDVPVAQRMLSMKKSLSPEFYSAWKHVVELYAQVVAAIPQYEQRAAAFARKCEECKNKNFTQQDMTAAGCIDSDTLAQCSEKLWNKCTQKELNDFYSASSSVNTSASYMEVWARESHKEGEKSTLDVVQSVNK